MSHPIAAAVVLLAVGTDLLHPLATPCVPDLDQTSQEGQTPGCSCTAASPGAEAAVVAGSAGIETARELTGSATCCDDGNCLCCGRCNAPALAILPVPLGRESLLRLLPADRTPEVPPDLPYRPPAA